MDTPPRLTKAVDAYRQEADIIGAFLSEYTTSQAGGRLFTSLLYSYYADWAKENGYRPLSNHSFVGDLHRRYEIEADYKKRKCNHRACPHSGYNAYNTSSSQ